MKSEVKREVLKAEGIESKARVIDLKELKGYLFPCVPTAPWHEQLLLQQLDGEEYPPSGGKDDVFDVYYVTSQLREFISDHFPNENFKFESDFGVGHHVDIKSMLLPSQKDFLVRRNGGIVKTTDLMRSSKYIMVCCFVVPDIWYSIAWYASVLCSELYTKLNENFEMVIVAKMRRGWTHDKAAFDHFLSGFHPSCLAVPFDAESHRNSLFMSLAGNVMSAKALLVAPSGNVLLHSKLHEFDGLELIPRFGHDARPFPFVGESNSPSLLTAAFFTTPSSLEEFLGCKTSDFVFRKIKKISRGSNDDALELREEKMVISQLKSKLVGLYLYDSGDLLAMLRKIDEACRQSDKEFEIVILYVPSTHRQDPWLFVELLSSVLAKQNISWWVAPFSYSASSRLNELFPDDTVIILGPNDQYVYPSGAAVMKIYGVDAYPFTLEGVIQKTLQELRQVTIESFCALLSIPCQNLVGRNVLFYFDYPYNIHHNIFETLIKSLEMLRAKDPKLVTYIFSLATTTTKLVQTKEELVSVMNFAELLRRLPWLMCTGKVIENFFFRFFNERFPSIVAFGEDGRIRSVCDRRLLSSHGSKAFPLYDNLLEVVSVLVGEYIERYEREEMDDISQNHWIARA